MVDGKLVNPSGDYESEEFLFRDWLTTNDSPVFLRLVLSKIDDGGLPLYIQFKNGKEKVRYWKLNNDQLTYREVSLKEKIDELTK